MPEWIRVRDKDTGHEYDLAPGAIREKAHEVLKDYPPNAGTTARPRPPKHRTDKAGRSAAGRRRAPAQNSEENDG